MIHRSTNREFKITCSADFDPIKTFECGQCFRWEADETGAYTGVAFDRVARVRRCDDSVYLTCSAKDHETVWQSYFDLDRKYSEILPLLCIDDFMHRATAFGAGIRILRQDKWEALCSFIISQNNNIPRIKKIIDTLCREFGEPLAFEGKHFYAFPSAAKIAALDVDDLMSLRCGYRADYIISAARMIADGNLDLEALSVRAPEQARVDLLKLYGVGNKVADCVLLYGFHMLDVFPLDVWMKRAVAQYYSTDFDPGIFSPYAGIAQQYIFNYVRNVSSAF